MSDEDERLKNFIIFKVPMTDQELGLDKPMPTWVVCLIIGFLVALVVGVGFLMTR